jgi:amino acid transporter
LFALGLAGYLKVVFDADPRLVGSLAIVGAALIALLKVQVGARITGIFLTVELIALAILTYLGFAQMERPISELLHPMVTTPVGGTAPAGFGLIAAGGAVALYLQAGFNVSIYLSEETKGPSSGVARATLWSLFAVILTTVVPVAAVLVGVTSVASFATDPSLTAFLINRGGTQLNTWLSLAVAAAIFNALIAILIVNARFLFSSGRDKAWPGPIGSWLGQLHSAYRTPWIAVAGLAIIQVVITLTLDVFSLTTFIGACLTAIYFTVALAAIASRIRDRDRPRPYRMPFWPLPPVVALVALAYVMTQQSIEDIWVSIAVIILSLTFYFLYLARKPEERWLAGRVAQESAKN